MNALAQFLKASPGALTLLKPGDVVEGTVIGVESSKLMIDLGRHGTGAVYRGELLNARDMVRGMKPGDSIHGKVITVDNEDGYVELSISEASRQRAWSEVTELEERDQPFTVTITGANRGGLTAMIGQVEAFLPLSQLAGDHYPKAAAEDKGTLAEALEAFVGKEFTVKIIEANSRAGKLIVSERDAVEESAKELLVAYEPGQVVDGIISGVADFGAFVKFVDNPAIEGLIHVSELDWRVVENPKEVVKVDDVVKVKILDIKEGKVSLSLKALKADPWLAAGVRYEEGQTVTGTVYSFNPFGATVNFEDGLQGQVHVTDFGGVEEMKKALTAGTRYEFSIEGVKPEERRITLKLKA